MNSFDKKENTILTIGEKLHHGKALPTPETLVQNFFKF